VVQSFTELLTPHGFDPEAVMPAYGLAEVTLAATGVRAGEGVRTIRADSRSLAVGREVGIAASDQPGFELVGCGAPLAGMAVRVVDGSGEAVPDGVLGEIEVRGPSVALGYVGDDHDEQFLDGAVRTGDAGFLDAGQLYVVGRLGESVKHLGRWVFPEDLERAAREASARPLRTTVLLGTVGSQDMAVVIAEAIDAEAAAQIGSAVAQQPHNLRVVVRRAPPGWIQRTTSGKPMRRAMWQQLITSHENTPVLWDTARA
jgi:acyl-CoA synthetase (AMP-forming)/AMP-acid ligase II